VELGRATAEARKALAIGAEADERQRKALAIGAEADERDEERARCAGFETRAPPRRGDSLARATRGAGEQRHRGPAGQDADGGAVFVE